MSTDSTHSDGGAEGVQAERGAFDSITETNEIDWQALFEEFGFDTPDAVGSILVSDTQLLGAIEASEQGIGGSAREHKEQALENGTLREIEQDGGHRGYQIEAIFE